MHVLVLDFVDSSSNTVGLLLIHFWWSFYIISSSDKSDTFITTLSFIPWKICAKTQV